MVFVSDWEWRCVYFLQRRVLQGYVMNLLVILNGLRSVKF